MLIALYIVAGVIGIITLCFAGFRTHEVYEARHKYSLSRSQYHKFSKPSRELIKEYFALPADHRPSADIFSTLRALDVKCNSEGRAEKHFYDSRYSNGCYRPCKFDWGFEYTGNNPYGGGSKQSNHPGCQFSEYYQLHLAIQGIKNSIAQRDRAMVLSAHAHNLDKVAELTASLRQERDIIEQVTKEIA